MSATFLGLPRFLTGGGDSPGDSGSCFRLPLFNGGGDGGGESASSMLTIRCYRTGSRSARERETLLGPQTPGQGHPRTTRDPLGPAKSHPRPLRAQEGLQTTKKAPRGAQGTRSSKKL